jgi:hypothetical protein
MEMSSQPSPASAAALPNLATSSTPATAAQTPERTNAITTARLTSMPASLAARRFPPVA